MYRIAVLLLCMVAFVLPCSGEQVWGRSDVIPSANAKYSARITERSSGVRELEVVSASSGKRLWGKAIDWTEGYSGFLSDDGSIFSVVNDDYSDRELLVFVYTEEGQAGYSVRQIPIGPEFLVDQGNKLLWIYPAEGNVSYQYDGNGKPIFLDLKALSGKVLEIGLK